MKNGNPSFSRPDTGWSLDVHRPETGRLVDVGASAVVRGLLCSSCVAEHDQLFKATFERKTEAASLLSRCLPADVAAAIDWNSLVNISPELTSPDLVPRQSDLLFRVEVNGCAANVIVLMEHQSSVDDMMALRAQSYVSRIWAKHAREPHKPLPLVLPVVVYQGAAPWNAPTALSALFAPSPGLEAFVPNFRFILIDLSRFSDGELRAKALTPAATLTVVALTQCRGAEHPEHVLEAWFDQLELVAQGADGLTVLTTLGSYVVRASAGPPEGLRILFDRLGNAGKEAFVTMAEIMGQEERQKGRQEGLQQGIQQGAAAILLRQLARKFGRVSDAAQRRIDGGSDAELARWAEQLLDAETISEALR